MSICVLRLSPWSTINYFYCIINVRHNISYLISHITFVNSLVVVFKAEYLTLPQIIIC